VCVSVRVRKSVRVSVCVRICMVNINILVGSLFFVVIDMYIYIYIYIGTPDVPKQPLQAVVDGDVRPMPVLIGNTRQEATLFIHEAFLTVIK